MNVLIEYNKMSLGECQVLLKFILENKHHLYEIIRKEDFYNDMQNMLQVSSNK